MGIETRDEDWNTAPSLSVSPLPDLQMEEMPQAQGWDQPGDTFEFPSEAPSQGLDNPIPVATRWNQGTETIPHTNDVPEGDNPLPVSLTPPQMNGKGDPNQGNGTPILDMATIAGLARWASIGIRRVGRGRIEAIIEIYRTAGHLNPGIDEILLQITRLADGDEPDVRAPMKDCIAVLLQLDALLSQGTSSEKAVLALLLDDREESYRG